MEKVLSIIKTRLNIKHEDLDTLIESYIGEIEQRIKDYCDV